MELKHSEPIGNQPTPKSNALSDTANKLADIELKIDHLIESIHDSLYRMKVQDKSREDSQ